LQMAQAEAFVDEKALRVEGHKSIHEIELKKKKAKKGKVKKIDEDMRNCNGRGFECAGRPEVWQVPILRVR
jgi:hypothetical protein